MRFRGRGIGRLFQIFDHFLTSLNSFTTLLDRQSEKVIHRNLGHTTRCFVCSNLAFHLYMALSTEDTGEKVPR